MAILQPAVSIISQRNPDYIKSLNLGLKAEPAVQVVCGSRRDSTKKKKKLRLGLQMINLCHLHAMKEKKIVNQSFVFHFAFIYIYIV